jgi:tetratricopeptide (TPR) repeat protein
MILNSIRITFYLILCGLAQVCLGQAHFKPIVLLGCIDQKANGNFTLQYQKVGFTVGDGTLIVTAEHCIDSFQAPPALSSSRRLFAVSPYYGDIFPVEILASDNGADVAILRATWPSHPAFALAEPNDLQGGDITLIPSRPTLKDAQDTITNQCLLEHLTVERINHKKPDESILFTETGLIERGWSGSPILLPESQNVTGVTCLITTRTKPIALFFKKKVSKAAGCHVQSIRDLVQTNGLNHSALAIPPDSLPDIPESEIIFGQIQDTFNALLSEDRATALSHIHQITKARPRSAYLHLWLANIAASQKTDAKEEKKTYNQLAQTALNTALTLAPRDPHILAVAGSLFRINHKSDLAKKHSQAALAQDPNNALALYGQLILNHATDPNQAIHFGQRLTSTEPNNTMAWFYTSMAHLRKYQSEEALHAAQQAIIADPNGLIRTPLANALVALDRIDEAHGAYEFMAQKCGCENCWYQYARFLTNHRSDQAIQAQQALNEARSAQRKKGLPPKHLDQLQVQIYKHTDPNQAEAMLRSWLEDDPNEGNTWWSLADILRAKKQYEQAAQAAQKAVDIDPNNHYRPRLADCLSKAGHEEAAQSVHDTMLKRHPERSRYWYYYAKFLQDSEQPDRALKALNQIDTRSNQRWQVSEKERDELLGKITQAHGTRGSD